MITGTVLRALRRLQIDSIEGLTAKVIDKRSVFKKKNIKYVTVGTITDENNTNWYIHTIPIFVFILKIIPARNLM